MIWLNECRRGCAEKGSRICSFIQMKCLNLSHHFGRGQRKSLFSWRSGVKQKMSFKHYCRYVVCFDVFDSGIHEVGRLLLLLICCRVCYCGSAHFDSLCECCSSTGRPVWKSSETRLQWWVNQCLKFKHTVGLWIPRHDAMIHSAPSMIIFLNSLLVTIIWSRMIKHTFLLVFFFSRLQPIYNPVWRGRLLTKTGMLTSDRSALIHIWYVISTVMYCWWQRRESAVKLSECGWAASHGVCRGDGPASGVQPRPRLHNGWEPLLPASQWIPGELPDPWTHSSGWFCRWAEVITSLSCDLSFQEQVIQIKLHSIRRIYKRRHGLRPLVSTEKHVNKDFLQHQLPLQFTIEAEG